MSINVCYTPFNSDRKQLAKSSSTECQNLTTVVASRLMLFAISKMLIHLCFIFWHILQIVISYRGVKNLIFVYLLDEQFCKNCWNPFIVCCICRYLYKNGMPAFTKLGNICKALAQYPLSYIFVGGKFPILLYSTKRSRSAVLPAQMRSKSLWKNHFEPAYLF